MAGILELRELLDSMNPQLHDDDVFCTIKGQLSDYVHLNSLATFVEAEGLTLVLLKADAEQAGLAFDGAFK